MMIIVSAMIWMITMLIIIMIKMMIIVMIISSVSLDFHGRLEAESQAGATRRMKQEASVSEQNTKTRLQEWEEEDGDKSPGFRKRRRRQSSTVTRKSARLAAATEAACEDGDEDYDPNTEFVNKPRSKPVRKLKKLQYFDEAVLVCSISFTSPTSSKKLFVNYWV